MNVLENHDGGDLLRIIVIKKKTHRKTKMMDLITNGERGLNVLLSSKSTSISLPFNYCSKDIYSLYLDMPW